MMRCSLDKVLLDARQLANKIRATDETADQLIKQASDAHNKVIAKKQCQEEILSFEELNQISKTRPRSRLMMCIASENKQLELLKQENKVLRTSLNEYETTFEMIMKKFRKHKNILKKLDQLEKGDFTEISLKSKPNSNFSDQNHILQLCSKISQLQKSIEEALIVDNKVTNDLSEIETKLLLENQELRRLVEINEEFQNELEESSILPHQKSGFRNGIEQHPPHKHVHQQNHYHSNKKTELLNGRKSPPASGLLVNGIISNKSIISTANKHQSRTDDDGDDCCEDEDEEDDHSSVASDASVKTLI